MKIYISAPMTGMPCFNFEAMFYFAHLIRIWGHEPLNPAEWDCGKMLGGWVYTPDQYEAILEEDCIVIREQADALLQLEGWEKSNGACREYLEAVKKGIKIVDEDSLFSLLKENV